MHHHTQTFFLIPNAIYLPAGEHSHCCAVPDSPGADSDPDEWVKEAAQNNEYE